MSERYTDQFDTAMLVDIKREQKAYLATATVYKVEGIGEVIIAVKDEKDLQRVVDKLDDDSSQLDPERFSEVAIIGRKQVVLEE